MEKKEQRIQDSILFLGNRNDVYRLYQAMDVFVLPSRYEGLPVVGVEAQAAGLPCVLSDKMTGETKMTDKAEFLSLNESVTKWSDYILKEEKTVYISDRKAEILGGRRFSAAFQSNKLFDFYVQAIK